MTGSVPFSEFPISIKISYFVSPIDGASEATGSGLAGLSIISSLFYYIISISAAIVMIKLFQMFDFLSFINVNMPSNFQNFITKFSNNIFSILPNFFKVDDGKYQCSLHPKLRDNDLSCLTINNLGGNLPVLVLLILVSGVGKVVDFVLFLRKVDQRKILESKKSSFLYWILRVKNMVGDGFYWAVFNGM